MFLKIELDITLDAFTLWNLMMKLSRTLSSEWDEVVEERRRGLVDTESLQTLQNYHCLSV